MNKPLSIALIVVGVLLLVFGLGAADSFGSHVTKAFSGHPTDKAMWLLIGGAAALVIGIIGVARSRSA